MTDLPALRQHVAEMRRALDKLERALAPTAKGETLSAWSKRWFVERDRMGYRNTEHERRRYQLWITPRLGSLAVAAITREDIEAWIEHVETKVHAGKLRATTAWRIWTVLRTMMRDASGGRVRALRVRSDNPTVGIRFDRGKGRVATFLYPSEFLRLVNCQRIPLDRRRLYALAVYLYPRAGELAALQWEDIDLRSGRVHIHRSLGRDGASHSTKTGEDRQFVAERAVLPLLRAMRQRAKGTGPIVGLGERTAKGVMLRRDLKRAGCTRADLFASDESRRPLTFHDLRATGITWMAMRGDSPAAISERVGHLHLSTTERYMRRGRLLVAARERVFPPLPKRLLGRAT